MSAPVAAKEPKKATQWLPSNEQINKYIAGIKQECRNKPKAHRLKAHITPLGVISHLISDLHSLSFSHPPVPAAKSPTQGLADVLETNPLLRMYFEEMIIQDAINVDEEKKSGKEEHPTFESVEELLGCIDIVLQKPPKYNDTALIGFPVNALLYYCMATRAGFAVFRETKINAEFKKILNNYGEFLGTDASLEFLIEGEAKDGYWFNPDVKDELLSEMVHEPNDKHKGFKHWNHFFLRQFKDGARPVFEPENDKAIVNAAESVPFALQFDVKLTDTFWLKHQPYSLQDMLGNHPYAKEFVGGTVYQAFLSAKNYHRWHSPVSGEIAEDPTLIEGTYYSESEYLGLDTAGPDKSQGYLTAAAARGVLFINAKDTNIGLMAFISVGMAEVSSNYFHTHIKQGYKVKKGEELGYFQFGGSTHCLIFRKGVIKSWDNIEFNGKNRKLHSLIATAN